MKSIIVLAGLLMIMSLAFSQDGSGWRGIEPLHSTRAQVEQLVGVLDLRCQCYSTEMETIRVEYASGPCAGALAGWNVPADTVLSLEIYPKKPLLFSELKLQKEDFIATVDDTVTTYYGNGEKGVRYAVTSSGTIASVWYGPSIKQNKLRCAGFPTTDGGVTAYKPYYEFQYETIQDVERLGEFGVRLGKERRFKGYVIIYRARDKKSDSIENLMMAAKNYLIEELNVDSNMLEIINGGYREAPTVEVFLLPSTWPRPIATPTFAGALKE
jgi:hypothetical protein